MAERSGFFNANNIDGSYDRQYDASDFTDYFSLFIGDGVFVNPANQLQVIARSGLSVTIKAGAAFIEGCWYTLTEDMDVNIPANVGQYAVNTNVCVTLSRSDRKIAAKVRPAVEDMLPVNNGNEHDLVLASISVGVGASQIIDANITDRRPDKTYCGYVTGLVDQIDTTDLFKQFTSEFETWFDDIVAKLGEEPATSLQTQVDALDTRMDAVETKSAGNETSIEKINTNIGLLSSLTTGVKTSIVNAINWLKTQVDGKIDKTLIINNLSTTASGRVLDARQGKTLYDMIGGALSQLTTGTKISIIAAINWLNSQRSNMNSTLTSLRTRVTGLASMSEISGAQLYSHGADGDIWVLKNGRMRICSFYIRVENATGTYAEATIARLGENAQMNAYGTAVEQNTGLACVVKVDSGSNVLTYAAKGKAIPAEAWLYGQIIYMAAE